MSSQRIASQPYAERPRPAGVSLLKPRKPGYFLFVVSLLLMLLLSGCSLLPSQQGNASTTPPAGLSPTPTISTMPTATSTSATNATGDWTTYHQNNNRTGYVANAPDPTTLTKAWSKQLDGAVYAEPLVVGGRLLVVTENDSLYAFDSQTGKLLWHTHVGTPVPQSALPCGNIFPLGITGTPVYDPATGLVFAVAEITGPAHILVGLDVATGKVKVRRSADISGMDARAHQQRAALALWSGMVYIAYGGLDGDCSDYRRTVVATKTDGSGALLSYRVPTSREAGIWATPGPSVDSQGHLYVAVGNGAQTSGSWDHSDSVLRLSSTLQLEDGFAPVHWPTENANDADLGSTGPILLPHGWIYADGKSGLAYVLKASNLGGIGGQTTVVSVCRAFGGDAAIGSQVLVPCTSGLRSLKVSSTGKVTLGWQASSTLQSSPIAGGHTVYDVDIHGTLYALNSATGAVRTSIFVGSATRFVTPTLSGHLLFVGTYAGIVAIKI